MALLDDGEGMEELLKALYNVNFLLHDLHCIGWGDLAKRLRGTGVHAGSFHLGTRRFE